MCVCIYLCMCLCMYVHMHPSKYAYERMHAQMHTNNKGNDTKRLSYGQTDRQDMLQHAYMYMHNMYTYMPAFYPRLQATHLLHTYMNTYIHTCIHTYIHTYLCFVHDFKQHLLHALASIEPVQGNICMYVCMYVYVYVYVWMQA